MLDLFYTNIPDAYRADPCPHLSYSDHISVMLIPAYRPTRQMLKTSSELRENMAAGAISALQDCFENTDWHTFREVATLSDSTNLECTSSVTSYISKCIDDVTVSRTITTCPDQRP